MAARSSRACAITAQRVRTCTDENLPYHLGVNSIAWSERKPIVAHFVKGSLRRRELVQGLAMLGGNMAAHCTSRDIKTELKMSEYATWGSQERFPTNLEAAYWALAAK